MWWLIGGFVVVLLVAGGALFYAGAVQAARVEATAHLRPGGHDRRRQ